MFGVQICMVLHCGRAPSLFVSVSEVKMSRQTTLRRFLRFDLKKVFPTEITYGNDFVSTTSKTVKCIYKFLTQKNILFKISASSLFLEYSLNFAKFSLDTLIK